MLGNGQVIPSRNVRARCHYTQFSRIWRPLSCQQYIVFCWFHTALCTSSRLHLQVHAAVGSVAAGLVSSWASFPSLSSGLLRILASQSVVPTVPSLKLVCPTSSFLQPQSQSIAHFCGPALHAGLWGFQLADHFASSPTTLGAALPVSYMGSCLCSATVCICVLCVVSLLMWMCLQMSRWVLC